MKKQKFRVGVLGATGMVGQRWISLLENHPWFDVVVVAASARSKGKSYKDAVKGRWKLQTTLPKRVAKLVVKAVDADFDDIVKEVDFVFCGLDLEKDTIKQLEIRYAEAGIPVISTNSAHRFTEDVPMIIPEVNPDHAVLIDVQRKNRGWKKGLITVKSNCSIQSYVAILTALKAFQPTTVDVVSLHAISGAGKTFATWPEMVENVIPFIGGEEEKSGQEPLEIWGDIHNGTVRIANKPHIQATCIRVPVVDGHMACVAVKFKNKPTKEQILEAVRNFPNPIANLQLPSAPKHYITYFDEETRPQTKVDVNYEHGMGITMGRLREDTHFDWKSIALSHNTIRGAAGGAILTAELLVAKGYIQ